MKTAYSIQYLSKSIGMEKAAEALSNAGIKLLNYTPGSIEKAREDIRIFEKYGLTVYQSHGPDNRYNDDLLEEDLAKRVKSCITKSAEVGAKYVAMHGEIFDYIHNTYTDEAALAHNYEFYAPAVELAEKLNIKIAFENTFADTPELTRGRPRFGGKAENVLALIDQFKSDHVCCCWDTGHAAIATKENQPEAIKLLGKRIECTHIHDNDYVHDKHLPPYEGSLDWKAIMDAFKQYTKVDVLCHETVYGEISEDKASEHAKYMYDLGVKLANL